MPRWVYPTVTVGSHRLRERLFAGLLPLLLDNSTRVRIIINSTRILRRVRVTLNPVI